MGHVYRMPTAKAAGGAVDYDVMHALELSVGTKRYAEIAEQATFELAARLGRLERAYRQADYRLCYQHALNICGIASQIGLTGVANVATDVMACANSHDSALPAVIRRLNILAEESLFSVFESNG